ncbi:universal stress protein [Rhizobium miluonense]
MIIARSISVSFHYDNLLWRETLPGCGLAYIVFDQNIAKHEIASRLKNCDRKVDADQGALKRVLQNRQMLMFRLGDQAMNFKTILAPIGVNHLENDLKQAIVFSEATQAHLSVLVVAMAAPPPVGGYGEIVSAAWLEEREGDLAKLADAVEMAKASLSQSGLSHDVHDLYTEYAWAGEDIAPRALYADLVLVGARAATDLQFSKRVIDGALFQSPTALLFNPTDRPATIAPRSIMIAWNSRMEAARAVQQALPLLKAADEVHVTMIDPTETASRNGEEPGADVATYLARHGISVVVDVLSGQGKGVAQMLARHAVDVQADLAVMGAYGHSRLREFVFGGVTRTMLETARLPIFWGH